MAKLLEYKCPSCGGALRFDASAKALVCSHCTAVLTPEEYYEETVNADMVETLDTPLEGIVSYICASCGGEIICEETAITAECPFCGGTVAVVGNISGRFFPKLIVPFALTKEDAQKALREHLKGKLLMKKQFGSNMSITEITGIYIPMWVYDHSFTATGTYNVLTMAQSELLLYIVVPKWYNVSNVQGFIYSNLAVSATDKVDESLLAGAAPFYFGSATRFDPSYLAGYYLHRSFYSDSAMRDKALNAAKNHAKALLRSDVGGGLVLSNTVDLSKVKVTEKYGFYPIWLVKSQWRGKEYTFAVNGQNGNVSGKLPVNRLHTILLFALIAVLVAAAVFGALALLSLLAVFLLFD